MLLLANEEILKQGKYLLPTVTAVGCWDRVFSMEYYSVRNSSGLLVLSIYRGPKRKVESEGNFGGIGIGQ